MARSNTLKVEAYIQISDDESVLWYEVLESGEVIWHLSDEEVKEYKARMKERIGRNMDHYLRAHPEASLWGKTN